MKFLTLLFALTVSSAAFAYTSSHSVEAQVKFRHWVELPESHHSLSAAQIMIQEQLYFLMGYMGYGEGLGSPKQDQKIENIQIEASEQGRFVAHYTYQGTMVLNKKFATRLKLALPNNPLTVFQTIESRKKGAINPCTDPEYPIEGSLWYFWNPYRPGCQELIKDGEDFVSFRPQVKILESSQSSYPEYKRLVDRKGRIQITILIGKNGFNRIRSPAKQPDQVDDLNAKTFRKIEKYLSSLGFEGRVWSNEEIKKIVPESLNPFPYVIEYSLQTKQGPTSEISVRMVYSNANLDHKTTGLRYFLKDALEKSSVVIYDGHSGLGSNLDPEGIGQSIPKEFRPEIPRDRYQIYFFNSCTSYAFYNFEFYKLKSPKNLDIFTAGLETPFSNGEKSEMALIGAIHQWAVTGKSTSYQELVRQMDNGNLIGVNGDQDNPVP